MTQYLTTPQNRQIAYRYSSPISGPTYVWLSGFKSDMSGSKVTRLEAWAKGAGYGFLAFDYSGHGQSDGAFEDGTISVWREDSLGAIQELTAGPLVLVGSSMGGWMALLAALALGDRVQAITLIAPAPDFTQKLMWPEFSGEQQAEIMEKGRTLRPSDYDEPYIITRDLIEDGVKWSLLDAPITLDIPIRILQGMRDADVPWQHALKLVGAIEGGDVILRLIKDGDHRLSREDDIQRLITVCADLAAV
ncbi:MAG: alpha/beta hydrolase [Pseudomonadota bacterium]